MNFVSIIPFMTLLRNNREMALSQMHMNLQMCVDKPQMTSEMAQTIVTNIDNLFKFEEQQHPNKKHKHV